MDWDKGKKGNGGGNAAAAAVDGKKSGGGGNASNGRDYQPKVMFRRSRFHATIYTRSYHLHVFNQ